MKLRIVLIILLLGNSHVISPCFDLLMRLFATTTQTKRNSAQELLSQRELDNKYNEIEQVTRFEIQRQTQLWNRGKISETEFKKNLASMYTELLFMLPKDRLKKLFPGIQLKIDEKMRGK